MISRLTLAKVALIVGSWTAFYYGMTWAKSLRDLSMPPTVFDLPTCERARLNTRKIESGQYALDTNAHRGTIDGCRIRGYRTE